MWAGHFDEVTGVDPSSKMLDAAKEKLPQEKRESVNYVHSSAEELSFLPDNSVDMVAAGAYRIASYRRRDILRLFYAVAQSCHWFEYPKVWREVSRVLKPLGTVAFWVRGMVTTVYLSI